MKIHQEFPCICMPGGPNDYEFSTLYSNEQEMTSKYCLKHISERLSTILYKKIE